MIQDDLCPACIGLKLEFESAPETSEFVRLSKKFVMVKTRSDDEITDQLYFMDGNYTPRIFFLDTNGKLLKVRKHGGPGYLYKKVPDIIAAMKKALGEFRKIR
ncbi:hypothetical protein OESDEN_14203 [Oesophagostomum dentatum]|uniref:Thioredoxin-like fold domain-containing protein n=1 Tax=Oesophagostomum dentatum TaxID=61180 RepID=A0A0B1SL53_OESDE|nr:hypothetical protein OESDEN_14203 [Oesophagostomum dentatum]